MFEQAGPIGTVIAFILGGLLMLMIGLCYAEATPGMLVWALQWLIVGFYSLLAIIYCMGSKKYREDSSEPDRARFVLEDHS